MSSPLFANVSYLIPTGEKPIYIASQGGSDAKINISAEFESRQVAINNGRELVPSANLDIQGFQLIEHQTTITDFYQLSKQLTQYENEIRQLVLAATGGFDVKIFDHTLRSDSPQVRADRRTREATAVVHNDYTDASAQKRLRDLCSEKDAEQLLKRRFAIVNVWRSIAGPVSSSPLACCDANTVDTNDLIASERRAEDRIGELELESFNPFHQWYFYPMMTREEALLIKTYDSAIDGRARRSVHTAFQNPLAPSDAPPRESMESRMIVFFDN
jgi:hypothetical protein